MYLCMYVYDACKNTYIHACMHNTYIHTCVHTPTHTDIHTYMYACTTTCAYMQPRIHARTDICMHTCHAHVCGGMHVHTWRHAHAQDSCTCMHVIHTRAQARMSTSRMHMHARKKACAQNMQQDFMVRSLLFQFCKDWTSSLEVMADNISANLVIWSQFSEYCASYPWQWTL